MVHYPVVYTRLLQWLTPILIFSYLAHCFPSEKITPVLFSALFVAALFQSAVAIGQYFTQAPLGLRILSEPHVVTGTFNTSDGSRWIMDRLLQRISSSHSLLRACGTLPHCNIFGGFMTLSLLASYSLIASASRKWVRYGLGLSLPLQFFAMSLSFSRSALFGWLLGTLFWFGYSMYRRGVHTVLRDPCCRFLALMVALSVTISGSLLFDQYFHRGGIINYNELAQSSDAVRIEGQNVAFQIIRDHPFFGAGYCQFDLGAAPYLPPNKGPIAPHNIYLFLATETGLISLAAFLAFAAVLFRAALRAPCTPQLTSLFAIFLTFLFIGGCDFYPFLSHQGTMMFFSFAGLLAACSRFSSPARSR